MNNSMQRLALLLLLTCAAPALAQPGEHPPLTSLRLLINGGNTYTNSPQVALEIFCNGAKDMRIGADPGLGGANWVRYQATDAFNYALPAQDGKQTVYAQFRDAEGNESEIISDEIILDKTPPQDPFLEILHPAEVLNDKKPTVNLKVFAADAEYVKISNQPSFYGAKWRAFKADEPIEDWALAEGEDGPRMVYAQFRDKAGNETAVVMDKISVDRQPPVRVKVVIAEGEKFVTDPNGEAMLTLDAFGADSMIVANESDFSDGEWQPYQTALRWTLPSGDGKKTVYVKFRDNAGNESETASDEITLDSTPPQGASLTINDGSGVTKNLNRLVTLNISASGADMMIVSNDSSFGRARWEPYVEKKENWQLDGEADGNRTIYVKFRDQAGNESDVVSANVELRRNE